MFDQWTFNVGFNEFLKNKNFRTLYSFLRLHSIFHLLRTTLNDSHCTSWKMQKKTDFQCHSPVTESRERPVSGWTVWTKEKSTKSFYDLMIIRIELDFLYLSKKKGFLHEILINFHLSRLWLEFKWKTHLTTIKAFLKTFKFIDNILIHLNVSLSKCRTWLYYFIKITILPLL